MQTYEIIEIFNVKVRWSKSSRLLQRVAFLVSFVIIFIKNFNTQKVLHFSFAIIVTKNFNTERKTYVIL